MAEKSEKRRCKDEDPVEFLPCEPVFTLKPEDEISVDSLISAILPRIGPPAIEFRDLKWDLNAKEFLNEKQSMLFEDFLYISKVHDNCKLNEDTKTFRETEMKEIGQFKFRVEESYDGYVVFGKSSMTKEEEQCSSGHWLRAKYDDNLNLVCEKRREYDYLNGAKIERLLDARKIDHNMVVERENKLNDGSQCFKAIINVKGRDDIFLFDGGVLLLLRYLVVNNFRGDFYYYSMNVFGKILRCQLTIHNERKHIKMFHCNFPNAIRIVNVQYFNDYVQEVSESFYTANGKIIMHYWHGFPYILHETKRFVPPEDPAIPKLELMWCNPTQFLDRYRTKKKLTYDAATTYFAEHPDLSDFIMEFLLNVIKHRPSQLLPFTVKYFQKLRKHTPAL